MCYFVEEQEDGSWDVHADEADRDSASGIRSKYAAIDRAKSLIDRYHDQGEVILKYLNGKTELA